MALGSDPATPESVKANGLGLHGSKSTNGTAMPNGHSSTTNPYIYGDTKPGSIGAEYNAKTYAYGTDPWPVSRYLRWEFLLGAALSVNFLAFWAFPIAFMGQLWKAVLHPFLHPVYELVDKNSFVRHVAETYIYSKPKYADFFVTLLMIGVSTVVSVSSMFWIQWRYGYLPWWSVALYYHAWWVVHGRRRLGWATHREMTNRFSHVMFLPLFFSPTSSSLFHQLALYTVVLLLLRVTSSFISFDATTSTGSDSEDG